MPNLITQYTNGTFEGDLATWGAEFGLASTAQIRDATQFYEGAHSVRFTSDLIDNTNFANGAATFLLCRFPGVTGQPYEVIIHVKVDANVPDDAVFYIDPFQPNFSNVNKGYTIPMRASQAKAGWVELRANFYANAIAGEVSFYVSVMFDSNEFREAAEFFPPGYDEFYNLLLGYSASSPIPAGAFVWMDGATADVKAIPEVPNAQFEGRRLYYIKNVFYLEIGGVRTVIDEPVKWDDVNIETIFDEKRKGYRVEFTDADVQLEFDNVAGSEALRAEYKRAGTNGDVVLLFCEFNTVTSELTVLYRGSVLFEISEDTEFNFKLTLQRESLNDKLDVYFDTRVNVKREFSLGGIPGTPLDQTAYKELYLHPHLMTFQANMVYNQNVDPELPPSTEIFGAIEYKTKVPPFTFQPQAPGAPQRTSNNIENLREPNPNDDGTLKYAGLNLPPGVSSIRLYFECRVSFSFTMGNASAAIIGGCTIYKRSGISTGGDGQLPPFLDPATDDTYIIDAQNYGNVAGDKTFDGFLSGSIELFADEAVFIKCWVRTGNNALFNITNFKFTNTYIHSLFVEEQNVFIPSIVKAPLLHELVNRQLEIITDKPNVLRSSFLGRTDIGYPTDGCGARHFSMDGKMLRDLIDRDFNLSAKDWYSAIDGLFNTGISVERDNDDTEHVVLEEMPYFFRDVLLIDLQVISGYVSRPASDYLFNELEFRFKKYPQDNQQDSLEDFHTLMSYITPLKKVKNKLSINVEAIVSGYYIEYTRREGFNTNPTNAYETDSDLFFIHSQIAQAQHDDVNITFDDEAQKITVYKLIPIVSGDNITITDATGGVTNGTYNVQKVDVPFTYDRVILTIAPQIPLPSTGDGTGDVTIVDVNAQPVVRHQAKRDEDFEAISGISFPKSAYNLHHQIARIKLRWAKLFQAGWTFCLNDPAQSVQFVEGKNNILATTRLKAAVACKFGDSLRLDRRDSATESVQAMDKPIFDKDEIEFNAPLTWTTYNYMRSAFEGRNPDGKDYGYIQWRKPRTREIERGYVRKMKFNPNTQLCSFTLIKKYDG